MTKKLTISAVPATVTAPVIRPVSVKRIKRMRFNWFVIGTLFGVGASFFMSFIVSTLVMPRYHAIVAEHKAMETAAAEQLAPASTSKLTTADRETRPAPVTSKPAPRRESLDNDKAAKELAMPLPPPAREELAEQEAKIAVAAAKEDLKNKSFRGFGTVRTSLFQAGSSAGIPFATMQEIVKAFSYDIDFQREIHPGDTIEVLMTPNKTATKASKNKKSDKTLANAKPSDKRILSYAALTLRGKKHEIFRFDNGGSFAWYDASGKSIKKSLLATPLNAAHITSGYGMREHPVLGYTKFHRGVDFAGAVGTPIMAAGDGVVTFKGWKNGYGNFVTIKHNSTYETAYGHISKFGKIKVGGRVKQGQVIAYVGMTGMATGPHLHYEVRMNGDQVNPTAKQFNLASGLSGKQLASFKAAKANIATELASLSKPTSAQVASR
jgi:murein DD-endopeptidase MepM/ murein hydrolase activator NlpD